MSKDKVLTITANEDNAELMATVIRLTELRKKIEDCEPEEQKLRGMVIDLLKDSWDRHDQYIEKIEIPAKGKDKVTVSRKGRPEIPYDQKEKMAELFKHLRPLLFPYSMKAEIINLVGLIEEITKKGHDPLDFLEVKIRPNADKAFSDSPNVEKVETLELGDKFFDKLNDNAGRFSPPAKDFMQKFLEENFETVVTVKA